jgi:hypothetical protein
MRSLPLLLVILVACGDNNPAKNKPDASTGGGQHDAKVFEDAKSFMDAPPAVDGTIGDVRAATDGPIGIKLHDVTVTYVKPQIGDPASDPAGFTIQTDMTGPAIMVAVDPTTLSPTLVAGDVVSFTATMKTTVSGQPRIATLTDLTRTSQGADLGALVQDISAATDLVTAPDSYDAELVTITGTLTGPVGGSGQGFQRFQIATAGDMTDTKLQLRAPTTVMNAIDMTTGCSITATKVTFSKFVASATTTNSEITVFSPSDFVISGCAAPLIAKAVAVSATSVKITFTRNIDPTSVLADGSQFTVAGLNVAANPVVSGKTVTFTTDAQTAANPYTVTVANTVKDLQGDAVATPFTANFFGYTLPATVVINEFNPTLPTACDMIELRVKTDGSMGNFRLTERDGSAVNYVFPAALQVHKNDFVIVHFAGTVAACNPAPAATDELAGDPAGQPAATHTKNFDTAIDLYSTNTTGLTGTTNVFTLYDATDTIVDAVFTTGTTSTAAAATLSQAAVVAAAGQWMPAQTTYTDTTFKDAAVDSSMQGATTATSMQRINDMDTNAKADWSTGVSTASTWGALNVGQTAFP